VLSNLCYNAKFLRVLILFILKYTFLFQDNGTNFDLNVINLLAQCDAYVTLKGYT